MHSDRIIAKCINFYGSGTCPAHALYNRAEIFIEPRCTRRNRHRSGRFHGLSVVFRFQSKSRWISDSLHFPDYPSALVVFAPMTTRDSLPCRVRKTVRSFIYHEVHRRVLRFIVIVHVWHADGAFLRGAFSRVLQPFSQSCRKRALLSVRRAAMEKRPFTSPAQSRWKSLSRITCRASDIRCKSTSPKARLLGVEVPNELPLKSNSRLAC